MSVIDILRNRLAMGHQTMAWPDGPAPPRSDRYPGGLRVDSGLCTDGCSRCIPVCPTGAIARADGPGAPARGDGPATLDLGRCIFCTECVRACPSGAITTTGDYRLAARRREDLALGSAGPEVRLAERLEGRLLELFGRSLRLRVVSAGGCNACEADVNVLTTIGWDISRFGIQFVASPRHADGLLVTGPVTQHMKSALEDTYAATPSPKIVIAVGACAISGGPFVDHPQVRNGAESVLPVDLFIPGCPPHPLTILDGLLRLLDRLGPERLAGARTS